MGQVVGLRGVYRPWRDSGFAVGARLVDVLADANRLVTAIWVVAAPTSASGGDRRDRMYEALSPVATPPPSVARAYKAEAPIRCLALATLQGVPGSERDEGVTLAELLAALATDLGLGQPMEHVLRSWRIAARLGEHIDLDHDEQASLYYIAVLAWVGCVADTPEVARWFGDDIAFRADSYQKIMGARHGWSGRSLATPKSDQLPHLQPRRPRTRHRCCRQDRPGILEVTPWRWSWPVDGQI